VIRLDVAESFAERLRTLEGFMTTQDAQRAPARIEDLQEEVMNFIDLVKLHPEIGRPAGALAASSVEGKRRLERVLQLVAEAGLRDLREYVLRSHVLLYAHSDSRVLLLSIRHQRELGYTSVA
jgi:plasmid stabilization system protein ParE